MKNLFYNVSRIEITRKYVDNPTTVQNIVALVETHKGKVYTTKDDFIHFASTRKSDLEPFNPLQEIKDAKMYFKKANGELIVKISLRIPFLTIFFCFWLLVTIFILFVYIFYSEKSFSNTSGLIVVSTLFSFPYCGNRFFFKMKFLNMLKNFIY